MASQDVEQKLTPEQILNDPKLNKDTAFTLEERQALGLVGLLPPTIETIDDQVKRALEQLKVKPNDLERYIYLIGLADRNETLFYKVIMSDPVRFIPIVYDPTVADACANFGHIYRRPRGLYLTRHMKDDFVEILKHYPIKDISVICVSTGGRILGLGDIGANGMGIPIGKLQLYTACAAVPPDGLLPILLDIGTSNETLRKDPEYLGLREETPTEDEIDAITDAFVKAANEVFPGVCVHFEDWKGTDAMRLLDRYRDKILCYNDDIQGTASVVLAGLTTALQIKQEKFSDQRVFFYGAGSAGIGIANMLCSAMQLDGLDKKIAQERIQLFDINGLISKERSDLNKWQVPYAADTQPTNELLEAIKRFKPTILIGVSTNGGAFTQEIVEEMTRLNEQPVIFALSNPTDRAECNAEQAYQWSGGKALYAAGVQFPEVEYQGKTFHPGQANNFLIFPAVGLAIFAARPTLITDDIFIEAAKAVAGLVDEKSRKEGLLYPPTNSILDMEISTALKVVEYIFDQGKASVPRPDNIEKWLKGLLYSPEYRDLSK